MPFPFFRREIDITDNCKIMIEIATYLIKLFSTNIVGSCRITIAKLLKVEQFFPARTK